MEESLIGILDTIEVALFQILHEMPQVQELNLKLAPIKSRPLF